MLTVVLPLWVGTAAMVLAVVGFLSRLVLMAVEAWGVPDWLDGTLKWLAVIAAVTMGWATAFWVFAAVRF